LVSEVAKDEADFDKGAKEDLPEDSVEVYSAAGVDGMSAWKKDIGEEEDPHEERSVLYAYVLYIRAISVVFKSDEVSKQQSTKEKRKESCLPHQLIGVLIVRAILEYGPESNFEFKKNKDIERDAPDVENKQSDSSKHGEDVNHRGDILLAGVELQNV
jgi:hypothetical protein